MERSPNGAMERFDSPEAQRPGAAARRPDLDWLRLIAFGLLLFFHAAMPFTSYGWHMNDAHKSVVCDVFVLFCHEFRLQALFFVSGAALVLSFGRRTPTSAGGTGGSVDDADQRKLAQQNRQWNGMRGLLGRRVLHLLLPLVFGLAVVIPPHAYFEYLAQGKGSLDFLSFWRLYLSSGVEPKGYIGWKHLWFLAYLLFLTLLLTPPLLRLARRGWFDGWRSPLQRVRPWHLLGLPLVLAINEVTLRGISRETMVIDDYAGLVHYGACMLLGAAATVGRVSDALARARWVALGLGLPAFLGAALAYFHYKSAGTARPEGHWLVGTARAVNTACWVVFWVGTFRAYASASPTWLRPASRFILPAYIVHQSVMVGVAYFVVRWEEPIGVKYAAIVLATAAMTGAIVMIVAQVPVLRACFGYWAQTPRITARAAAARS